MPTCSICGADAPKDAAEIVDRLLHEGAPIESVIVAQTNFSRAAVYRHRKNPKCSFRRNRAARVSRNRKPGESRGRVITVWPGDPAPDEFKNKYFYYGRPIPMTEFQPSDTFLVVAYARPLAESLIDAALAEDAFRTKVRTATTANPPAPIPN